MRPSLSSVSHLPCLWEESDSWGLAPSLAITKRKGQSHMRPGLKPCRRLPGGPQCGEGSLSLCYLSQELKRPYPARGQKDSMPPDPQMLHEHIRREVCAPSQGPGHPSPSAGCGLQPRCLLSLLTQKCFILPARPGPGPAGEGQSRVKLRFFASLLSPRWGWEEE